MTSHNQNAVTHQPGTVQPRQMCDVSVCVCVCVCICGARVSSQVFCWHTYNEATLMLIQFAALKTHQNKRSQQ